LKPRCHRSSGDEQRHQFCPLARDHGAAKRSQRPALIFAFVEPADRGARPCAHNPEAITQYNIVPGLMGVVLTMTMTMITALAITRERERGTMENLLSTADASV